MRIGIITDIYWDANVTVYDLSATISVGNSPFQLGAITTYYTSSDKKVYFALPLEETNTYVRWSLLKY